MSFGYRLRQTIKASGLSKAYVAGLACTDQPHLYRMLADRSAPSLETLRRLLSVLPDADARWLVCGGKK